MRMRKGLSAGNLRSLAKPAAKVAGGGRRQPAGPANVHTLWLYGVHAALAALANRRRRVHRITLTAEFERRHGAAVAAALERGEARTAIERVTRKELAALLPKAAVHQGIAVLAEPLAAVSLDSVCRSAGAHPRGLVLVLDQVSDPHNVGAVMRSAAAFGAQAVLMQDRHAPPETGALAKAASGALEHLPLVRVTNLARALDALKDAGFWCVGLARRAETALAETDLAGRVAIVLGAEGAGLRRLTAERCDILARLPTGGPIADLNVSNAAAIALYEAARRRGAG